MKRSPQEPESGTARWTLLRDLGVLQVKLLVDGMRDIILVPASLIAGIISIATSVDGKPGLQFYHLLAWGKESELWINLFGAAGNSPEGIVKPRPFGDRDIDDVVGRLESFVIDEVNRGGVTAQAKERLDKILDAVQSKRRQQNNGE